MHVSCIKVVVLCVCVQCYCALPLSLCVGEYSFVWVSFTVLYDSVTYSIRLLTENRKTSVILLEILCVMFNQSPDIFHDIVL